MRKSLKTSTVNLKDFNDIVTIAIGTISALMCRMVMTAGAYIVLVYIVTICAHNQGHYIAFAVMVVNMDINSDSGQEIESAHEYACYCHYDLFEHHFCKDSKKIIQYRDQRQGQPEAPAQGPMQTSRPSCRTLL